MSQVTRISRSERRQIAAAMQINEQYLYMVLTRRRQAPIERCADLERLSGGRETCEALRPDVPWTRIPDPAWAWHPAGRPVIDMARPGWAPQAEEPERAAA